MVRERGSRAPGNGGEGNGPIPMGIAHKGMHRHCARLRPYSSRSEHPARRVADREGEQMICQSVTRAIGTALVAGLLTASPGRAEIKDPAALRASVEIPQIT